MDIHVYWDIIKAYSGLCRHIQHLVLSLALFQALPYLELEAYWKLCETLNHHVQNLAIKQFIHALFNHIQEFSELV